MKKDESSRRLRHPCGGLIPRGMLVGAIVAALLPGCEGRPGGTSARVATGANPADTAQPSPDEAGPISGVRRMRSRLDKIIREMDPAKNQFLNRERVQILSGLRTRETDPLRRARLTINLAIEMNRLGANEQAIAFLQPLLAPPREAGADWPPPEDVHRLIALCLYRLGITENCMANPNPSRCLLPVSTEGAHRQQRGARGAMEESLAVLAILPDDLASIWVLNIAAMQIGQWPGGVPERFRIAESVFASDDDIGHFPNVAIRAGLGAFGHAGGAIMEDFDGDGLLDILVTSMGLRDPMHLYHNEGTGAFTEVTESAGLVGETGGLNLSDADYDNDGDVDVLVLRGGWAAAGGRFPNSLLRNDGHGHFEDVTDEAGILTFRPTQVGVWGDYDNDGWLDLFIGNESRGEDRYPSELWRNNGDGTFTDQASVFGNPDIGFVKGAGWGDYDNDGDVDLYVSTMRGDNHLYRNDGPWLFGLFGHGHWKFIEVTREAGVPNPQNGFPTWLGTMTTTAGSTSWQPGIGSRTRGRASPTLRACIWGGRTVSRFPASITTTGTARSPTWRRGWGWRSSRCPWDPTTAIWTTMAGLTPTSARVSRECGPSSRTGCSATPRGRGFRT